MARSRMERLKAALAAGDLEAAKKLAAAIEASSKPAKKPKRKQAPRVKEVAATPPAAPERPSGQSSTTDAVLNYVPPNAGQHRQSGLDPTWMAPSRSDKGGGRVAARRVTMEGRQHVNHFDEWAKGQGRDVDAMDPKIKRVEKALAKSSVVPRPGQHGAARPPAQKVQTTCDGCGRQFAVYQSELTQTYEEDGRPYLIYKCERCIRRGR